MDGKEMAAESQPNASNPNQPPANITSFVVSTLQELPIAPSGDPTTNVERVSSVGPSLRHSSSPLSVPSSPAPGAGLYSSYRPFITPLTKDPLEEDYAELVTSLQRFQEKLRLKMEELA